MRWCKEEQFSSFLLEDSQGLKNYHASSYTSSGTDLCRMNCPGGGESTFQLVGRPWAVLVSWSFKLLIVPNSAKNAEKVELPCRRLWVSSLVKHHSAAQHVLTSSDSPPPHKCFCAGFKLCPRASCGWDLQTGCQHFPDIVQGFKLLYWEWLTAAAARAWGRPSSSPTSSYLAT
jgi:hypothetical protein